MQSNLKTFVFLILLLGSPHVVSPQTTKRGIRGEQYCEILWGGPIETIQDIPDDLKMIVSWNGFNGRCQANPGFYNISAIDVYNLHEEKAELVKFNGVREYLIDESIQQGPPNSIIFDKFGTNINEDGSGLLMMRVAEVLAREEIREGENDYYVSRSITRNVTFVWHAGKTVYELVAPNCATIYTMQSFMVGRPGSWGIRGDGGINDFPSLAEDCQIILPEGWVYRTRTLRQDLFIEGKDGVHAVLQDNLENSYFQMDTPFNRSLCPIIERGNGGDDDDDDDDNDDSNDPDTELDNTDTIIESNAKKCKKKAKKANKNKGSEKKSSKNKGIEKKSSKSKGSKSVKGDKNGAANKKNKDPITMKKEKKEEKKDTDKVKKSEKTKSEKTKSEKTKSEKTKSEKTKLEKTKSEKAKSGKTKSEKTKSGEKKSGSDKKEKKKNKNIRARGLSSGIRYGIRGVRG